MFLGIRQAKYYKTTQCKAQCKLWNMDTLDNIHSRIHIGHVKFMLFVQCKCSFWWNMGFRILMEFKLSKLLVNSPTIGEHVTNRKNNRQYNILSVVFSNNIRNMSVKVDQKQCNKMVIIPDEKMLQPKLLVEMHSKSLNGYW